MRAWGLVAGATWFLCGLASAQPAPAPAGPPPLEAYGQLPGLEDMQISPNGELLAFVRTDGDQRTIVIQRTDQPKLVASLAAGATKLRRLRWADDRHLLITVSTTARVQDIEGSKREWFIVSSFDVVTGKQIHLLDGAGDAMNVVVGG